MPEPATSSKSTSQYITPITCPRCSQPAHLMRRTPHGGNGGERRIFECRACGKQTEITSE